MCIRDRADNDTFGAKRKERLDSVSAAVILESFLNWRAHHPDEEPPELVQMCIRDSYSSAEDNGLDTVG